MRRFLTLLHLQGSGGALELLRQGLLRARDWVRLLPLCCLLCTSYRTTVATFLWTSEYP